MEGVHTRLAIMSETKLSLALQVAQTIDALFKSEKPKDKRLVARAQQLYAKMDQDDRETAFSQAARRRDN